MSFFGVVFGFSSGLARLGRFGKAKPAAIGNVRIPDERRAKRAALFMRSVINWSSYVCALAYLRQHLSNMWSLKQLADVVERSVLNVVDGYDASTELPSGNVDIRHSMFLKYRDEDVRVASFVDWPHKNPSPKELAKHGFFHTPLPDVSDRVACCACGKILFNWTEADNIEEGHRKFSPECPIILGIPLQLPSSVSKAPASNLAFFVSNLQNGQQCEDDRSFPTPPSSGMASETKRDATPAMDGDAPSSGTSAASSLWQFDNADVVHNSENAEDASTLATSLKRKKSGKKSGRGGKASDVAGAQSSEDAAAKTVEFADLVPPLGQAVQGTEVDHNSASASTAALVFENAHILPIEAIARLQDGVQTSFLCSMRLVSGRVDGLWQRLSSLNAKVEIVQRGQWIRDISMHASDAARTREQSKAACDELASLTAQLQQRRASLEALGDELARRERAQREAIEIEASVAQHRQQLSDLIRKQECLQLSFASLNAQYEGMDAEVAQRRDELRLQISALVEEKCSLEVALSLHHERLEAQVPLHFAAHLWFPLNLFCCLSLILTPLLPICIASALNCNRSPLELIAAEAKKLPLLKRKLI